MEADWPDVSKWTEERALRGFGKAQASSAFQTSLQAHFLERRRHHLDTAPGPGLAAPVPAEGFPVWKPAVLLLLKPVKALAGPVCRSWTGCG